MGLIYRTLRAQEIEAWYDHCDAVFVNEARAYFVRHYEMDPEADLDLIFVAVDGETIAGTVRVFNRRVWMHGQIVPMGGIGEVSVKPAYRKRGIATTLLRIATDAMCERGMVVSILFGNEPLYYAEGWRFVDLVRTRMEAPPPGKPMREDDLPLLMGMYDLFAGRFHGAIVRDEAYWRQWVLPMWGSCELYEMGGRPVAYRALNRYNQGVECCAAPDGERFLRVEAGGRMMIRLLAPFGGYADTDALCAGIQGSAGMFSVDHF